jgi:hypothetical protein
MLLTNVKKLIHIENKKLSQILSYIHSLYASLSLSFLKNILPPLFPFPNDFMKDKKKFFQDDDE